MRNIFKIKLKGFGNEETGILTPIELGEDIPFNIKRIFYIYDVQQDSIRGSHAYYKTNQVLICVNGSLSIKCFDSENEVIYDLNSPEEALYISPNIWRTTFNHSKDAILLVLSSLEYDESDYIRDYDKYMEVVKCT